MSRYHKYLAYILKGIELILQLIRTKLIVNFLGAESFGTFALFQNNYKLLLNIGIFGQNKTYLNKDLYKNNNLIVINGYLIILQLLILIIGNIWIIKFYDDLKAIFLIIPAFIGVIGTYYSAYLKINGRVIILSIRSLLSILFLLIFSIIGLRYNLSLFGILGLGYLSSIVLLGKNIKLEFSSSSFYALASKGFWYAILSMMVMGAPLYVRTKIWMNNSEEIASYYAAWWTIINTYLGVFFMTLSGIYINTYREKKNQNSMVLRNFLESSIYLGILLVILMSIFNTLIPYIFSKEFITVKTTVLYSIPGLFLKSLSWQLGFKFSVNNDILGLTISDFTFGFIFAFLTWFNEFKFSSIGPIYSISYMGVVIMQFLYNHYVDRERN